MIAQESTHFSVSQNSKLGSRAYMVGGRSPVAEGVWSLLGMGQKSWITDYVNAYWYFGGAARILTPNSLKVNVLKNSKSKTVLNKRKIAAPSPKPGQSAVNQQAGYGLHSISQ